MYHHQPSTHKQARGRHADVEANRQVQALLKLIKPHATMPLPQRSTDDTSKDKVTQPRWEAHTTPSGLRYYSKKSSARYRHHQHKPSSHHAIHTEAAPSADDATSSPDTAITDAASDTPPHMVTPQTHRAHRVAGSKYETLIETLPALDDVLKILCSPPDPKYAPLIAKRLQVQLIAAQTMTKTKRQKTPEEQALIDEIHDEILDEMSSTVNQWANQRPDWIDATILDAMVQSIHLTATFSDKQYHNTLLWGIAHDLCGHLYHTFHDTHNGLCAYQKALLHYGICGITEQTGAKMAALYHNLGCMEMAIKQSEQAESHFLTAAQIASQYCEHNDAIYQSICVQLQDLYETKGQSDKAAYYAQKSIEHQRYPGASAPSF